MMTPSKIYLRSWDKHDEVLEYELPKGTSRVISRRQFEALKVPRTMGAFTREKDSVAGVFATPDGPTFFVDAQRVVRPFGQVKATVVDVAHAVKRFTMSVDGAKALELVYGERDGIGTNPYDVTEEDVDLCAMIAAGTKKKQFFDVYTKPWEEPQLPNTP